MASFLKDEPLFIIGMEIVFDSRLEEAMNDCSIYDRSSEAGSGYTLEDRHGSTSANDEGESGTTLNNLSGDDDGSSSSDESGCSEEETNGDVVVQGPGDEIDDELMARLTSAYIDTDSEESEDDDDGDNESDSSDSDDASWRKDDTEMQQQRLLGISVSSKASSHDRSFNTNIAVMLDTSLGGSSTQGQLSISSRGGLGGHDRRRRSLGGGAGAGGPTTGRSRRHKGTRSRTCSPGPASDRRMKDLKDNCPTPDQAAAALKTLTPELSQLEAQLQLQVRANPVA